MNVIVLTIDNEKVESIKERAAEIIEEYQSKLVNIIYELQRTHSP